MRFEKRKKLGVGGWNVPAVTFNRCKATTGKNKTNMKSNNKATFISKIEERVIRLVQNKTQTH